MRTKQWLLAATLLACAAGAAIAQNVTSQDVTGHGATYDTSELPATQGKVGQYSLTPRGDVDGLIMTDGTEVFLPPHLGTQLVFAVKPGDAVTIHGLHARALPMVQAMSIKNDATGATVTDSGPGGAPGPDANRQAMNDTGRVKAPLHGPRGDVNGALLEDGTIIRLPPPEAVRLASTLTVGAPLSVQGLGTEGPLGKVIEARAIGPDASHLQQVAVPPKPPGHHPPGGPGAEPPPPAR